MLLPPPTETYASTSVCSAVLYKGLIYHAVKKEVQNTLTTPSKQNKTNPKTTTKNFLTFRAFIVLQRKTP